MLSVPLRCCTHCFTALALQKFRAGSSEGSQLACIAQVLHQIFQQKHGIACTIAATSLTQCTGISHAYDSGEGFV